MTATAAKKPHQTSYTPRQESKRLGPNPTPPRPPSAALKVTEGFKPGELVVLGGPTRSVSRVSTIAVVQALDSLHAKRLAAYSLEDTQVARTVFGKLQGIPHTHKYVALPPKDSGPADRGAAREAFGLRGRKHQESRGVCRACKGSGLNNGNGAVDCRACKGSGEARR